MENCGLCSCEDACIPYSDDAERRQGTAGNGCRPACCLSSRFRRGPKALEVAARPGAGIHSEWQPSYREVATTTIPARLFGLTAIPFAVAALLLATSDAAGQCASCPNELTCTAIHDHGGSSCSWDTETGKCKLEGVCIDCGHNNCLPEGPEGELLAIELDGEGRPELKTLAGAIPLVAIGPARYAAFDCRGRSVLVARRLSDTLFLREDFGRQGELLTLRKPLAAGFVLAGL